MKIAVFLGANYGSDDNIIEETRKLGTWIGKNHHTLVYGGSKTGLMNVLAESTKMAGGKVIGVEARIFYEEGKGLETCDEFYVEETMAERKKRIMDTANAFVALPGGTGTLDEISEIMVLDKLEKDHRIIILLNIDGFYDDLMHQLDKMVSFGYLREEDRNLIHFANSVDDAAYFLR